MTFFDRFRSAQAPAAPSRVEPPISAPATIEEKYSAAGPIYARHVLGQAVWTPRNYEQLARESYLINAVSFRCTKMIATCAANIPLLLKRGKMEVAEHPILDLLKRPSATMGGKAFFERFASFTLLSGNGYIEAVGPKNQPPRELWAPRSDRMKVLPGITGLPSGFEYEHGGAKKVWSVSPLNGKSDILHVKEFHPLNDWYGMSRIEAAAYGVDRHNAASAHNKALLDNGARPSGMMVFKPLTGDGQPVSAPKEVIEKAEKELMQRHNGPENAGKPMVVNGAVEWVEMGLSPKDMDFDKGKDDAARDICLAWGVPHILVVKGQSTYNNVSEAKLELYEDNVIPFLGMVLDELNNWLCPRYGEGFRLEADLDAVSALEERRVARRKSVTELVEAEIIDEDEGREMLGYGPRPENSVEKVDAGVLTALIGLVETAGIVPLARYMRAVGLVPAKMTDDQILQAALAAVEDEPEPEDDDDDTTDPNADEEEDDDDAL
ncbi:phage portal protein [Sulfitobacter pseudonitzschiae]|uniref:Phage portal protein n=1 Tax=Pseudosulfitobacter pseudonitzschiae TaxID=1402135 RepID=A0A9Q2NKJ9_9RHOB|nr:phage portal protein [Pseudosulfitobacter pseudonitzschiae]MBM2293760.1 phage portal protein [Pseudosulfitobacter pseudonitzschiae]MBM2298678.1 phage portal protein [Pseudosulfitobacter pseudonitzschiae]MBM2303592.1 phage portal protein [Pseudosulfitobacter pseudonitzschiae]MBM2313375.1 phage portal protein [Pseudosulfitobacter pseudonitzschiae]MBM2318288.1 phage portal protein [Pseudosulfitobacter pseudonitzschiae]